MRRPSPAMARPAGSTLMILALILASCTSPGSGSPAAGGEASQPAGGGGDGAGPGTDLTACELVTPTDIETALSLDPGAASEGRANENPSDEEPYANECIYLAQDWGGLSVQALPSFGGDYYGSLVSDLGDRAETVDIGDGGLWVDDIERGYFVKGSVMVIIQFVSLADRSPFREPSIALGEAAIAKL